MKRNLIWVYLMSVTFGIVMLIWPAMSLDIVCYACGIVLLLIGIYQFYSYVKSKRETSPRQIDLATGGIACVFGLILLMSPVFVVSLLPFIMGVFVFVSGCIQLFEVYSLKRIGYDRWLGMLIVALAIVIIGVVVMFNPFTTVALIVRVIGVAIIISGVGHIWSTFQLQHNESK